VLEDLLLCRELLPGFSNMFADKCALICISVNVALKHLIFPKAQFMLKILGLFFFCLSRLTWAADSCGGEETLAHGHTDTAFYATAMEASAAQKAAFGAQARPGKIADFGSGSGISAHDLALLYPGSQVVGVDLDPAMIQFARDKYKLKNLSFKAGDATKLVFARSSLDSVSTSSTPHHLTSFNRFRRFDTHPARDFISAVYEQLKLGGLFIWRDFAIPDGPEEVLIELPRDDGKAEGDVTELSTSALFRVFCRDFRSGAHPNSEVKYANFHPRNPGFEIFQVSYRDAIEFARHKDYRENWDAEIQEEYAFWTQAETEKAFREGGFRVLHSAPITNPWLIENRYKGKIRLYTVDGRPMALPATNYAITGQKISPGEGLRLQMRSSTHTGQLEFLRMTAMKERKSQNIFEIVERPNETIDILPFFTKAGSLYVLGKQGFPRPILTALKTEDHLDGVHTDGYVVEPISFIKKTSDGSFDALESELQRRTGISPTDIERGPQRTYVSYSSPGLVAEKINSTAIQIKSRRLGLNEPDENYSGFSTSGVVRPFEAKQILRSMQVGANLDSRLEISVYQLLLDQKKPVGIWIGEEYKLSLQKMSMAKVRSVDKLLELGAKIRAYDRVEPILKHGRFLQVFRGNFDEVAERGKVLASATREYVLPRNFGPSVASVFPVIKTEEGAYIGLERRQFPAMQINEGSSELLANPSWRLDKGIKNIDDAEAFVRNHLDWEFRAKPKQIHRLGASYYPTPGLTPEVIYPFFVEVDAKGSSKHKLEWVLLSDLLAHRAEIKNSQLLIGLFRLSHALELIR
jgi:hypothetical protein